MKTSRGVSVRTMLIGGAGALSAAFLVAGSRSATATAQPQVGGSTVFKTYCASCHGVEARGDGPLAEHLRTVPPDLTKLASSNRGKFDSANIARIIDGRNPVKGHGGPDMPVWGDAFKQSREGYSEDAVKARIEALVEFLESIQGP